MDQGNIYVESLSSGKGEWFGLPVSEEIVASKIVGEDQELGEYIILDYDTPFYVYESYSLEKVNELWERWNELPKEIADHGKEICDFFFGNDYEEFLDSADRIYCLSEVYDKKTLGYHVCDEGLLGVTIPSELENYLDYEAIGRDYEINSNILFCSDMAFEFS